MPFDDNKLNLFKETAIGQGHSEEDVNNFVDLIKQNVGNTLESTSEYTSGLSSDIQSFLNEKAQNLSGKTDNFLTSIGDLKNKTEGFLSSSQGTMLPGFFKLTQPFGNRSSIERYSGGINLGADFATPIGTPVALPAGKWVVSDSFGNAREGVRGANKGYGNSVEAVNLLTGETLRFSHLSNVGVVPGQQIEGGSVIGTTGNTGNSTGPHVSILYKDAAGKIIDILKSPYRDSLFG